MRFYDAAVTAAVLVVLYGLVSTQTSNHIEDDCREIHCPQPSFDCPIDSELKSSASDEEEEDDEDSNSNPFDRLADEGLIEFFPNSMLQTSTQLPHVVQKRSLQHRRREAIKIVPGDYRSFEPEFFKYHNHHQPHRKWKRDLTMGVQPHSEAEIKKCCPEFQCVCRTCPGAPKCDKGKVAIMVEEGHDLPGSCCSKYECVPEWECSATSQRKISYWKNECTKCDCIVGQELCKQLCEIKEDDSANNCFSGYLNRPMMNGDSWLEDQDCKECKCINGDSQCEESFCKPVDCSNPVKIEGICCKVCPSTTSTTTTTTEATEINSTTDIPTTDDLAPTSVPSTEVPVKNSLPTKSSTSSKPTSTTSDPELITDEEDDITTFTAPTVIISTPKEMGDLIDQIDLIIILGLVSFFMASCAIGTAYVITQSRKKKKSMYSTIPSSESSQSSSVTLA